MRGPSMRRRRTVGLLTVASGVSRAGSSCCRRTPERAEKVTAPLAPKMVNCSSTGIPARVVTIQPSAHSRGMATAHHQRRRVCAGSATVWATPMSTPVSAPMTATSASEVRKPTTVAPSSRPAPMPSAVARIHAAGRSRPRLTSHCPVPMTAPVMRPATKAAMGLSTRPATTPPTTPATGKARNPAVQISHETSARRVAVEGFMEIITLRSGNGSGSESRRGHARLLLCRCGAGRGGAGQRRSRARRSTARSR